MIYFGETCFGHKILGLSHDKSEELTKSVQHIRRLTQKFTDDEEVKKALHAQRSLIEALHVVHAEIPAEIQSMDDQDIPLMKAQMRDLADRHQEYLKNQMKKKSPVASFDQPHDSWTALQNFAKGIISVDPPKEKEPASITPKMLIDKDYDLKTKVRETFEQLPFDIPLSAVDISFEIERKCMKRYGYFLSGKPKLYTELLLFLLDLKDKGSIEMISGDTNDFVFKKVRDNKNN